MTWESLQAACLGKLGLSFREFWQSSLYDLNLRLTGFFELEEERQRQEWERTRWGTWLLLNPHLKKQLKKPTDLIEFPWEHEEKKVEVLTEEERQKRFARMDRQMKKKYG